MKNIKTKTTSLFAISLAALLVSGCKPEEKKDPPSPEPEVHEWELVFADEFEGSVIDDTKWAYEVNCWGGGNDEHQCYVEDPDNVYVADGKLHIKAIREEHTGPIYNPDHPEYNISNENTKPFTSGRLRSVAPVAFVEGQDPAFDMRNDWKYGRVEIRAKVPAGQGTWAAAWMLPTDYEFGGWAMSGEIDILEAVNIGTQSDADDAVDGQPENRVYGTLHYGRAWPGNVYTGESYAEIADPSAGFHTYTIEWEEGAIRWFVDDVHYATQTQEGWYTHYQDENGVWQTSGTTAAPFDQKFHIILNLAMGGNWAGQVNEKGVDPDIDEALFLVDYVRVYQCEGDETGVACGTKGAEGTYTLNSGVVEPSLPLAANFGEDVLIVMDEAIRGDWQLAKWDGDGNDEYEFVEDAAGNYLDLQFNGNGAAYLYGDQGKLSDFTDYAGGELSFKVRWVEGAADSLTLGIAGPSLTTPGDAATATIDQSEFGTVGATEWTTVTVDVNEMMNAKPALDYSKIDVPFKLVQNGGTADLHIQIKDIQFTKADFEATAPTTGLFTVFDNAIKANWTAWKDSGSTDAVLALDDDTTYGNVVEFTIDGNHVVGFSTRSDHGASSGLPHNASENTALEFDLKISTMPAAGVVDWKLKLESPGAASALELNLTDSIEGEAPELDVWKHFTFSIANLETRGLDIENIDVIMIFPAWGSGADAVFSVDNVKFTNTEVVPPPASAPATAAPSPTEDEANVISIFSDAYTDVAGTNFNPSWGQSTVSTQVDVAGNNTLKYANLNYQGTEFTAQDVSAKTSVHVDFWTADATDLQLFLISPGPVETAYSLSITQDEWVSIDIPLSNFTGVDLADVFQFKVVGNGTVFLDNLYFH